MDKNKYIDWVQDNEEELINGFLDSHDLKQAFDEYCLQEFDLIEQGQADVLYDSFKEGV